MVGEKTRSNCVSVWKRMPARARAHVQCVRALSNGSARIGNFVVVLPCIKGKLACVTASGCCKLFPGEERRRIHWCALLSVPRRRSFECVYVRGNAY